MNPHSDVKSLSWLSLTGRLDPLDRLARLAALRHDQYRRWHLGERVPVEEYLLHVPGLVADREMVLDLIYSELVLRVGLSEEPSEQEYVGRFPDRADSIRKLLVLHRCLREASRRDFSSSETLTPTVGSSISTPAQPTSAIAPPGYELLGKLGEGGMGVVWKARQTGLHRLVALKLLKRPGSDDLKRFRAEAQSAARLHHPNIVQVYDSGIHEGIPYLAQELVEGGSLAELLRHGPLPPREAAVLIEAMACGVQHAHERNVLHRDLKPANVLLAHLERESVSALTRTPKVTDFGLAKQIDDDRVKTTVGTVLGTPSYMPPEQACGDVRAIGPAGDVYSIGATLYECLTGRPPFRGDNVFDTLVQVQNKEPTPLRELNPNVPAELETICLRCLKKVPAQRYATAAALADALRGFLAPRDQPTLAEKPSRSRRPVAAAMSFAFLTIAAVAALFVLHVGTKRNQRELERRLAESELERDGLTDRLEDAARRADEWRKTETEMVAEADRVRRLQKELDAKQQEIEEQKTLLEPRAEAGYGKRLADLDSMAERRTPGWTRDTVAELAALNKLKVSSRNRTHELRLAASAMMGFDRGPERVLLDRGEPTCLTFPHDGSFLAVAEKDAVRFINRDGKLLRTLTVGREGQPRDRIVRIAFSPDRTSLAAGTQGGKVHLWLLSNDAPTPWFTYAKMPLPVCGLSFDTTKKQLCAAWKGEKRVCRFIFDSDNNRVVEQGAEMDEPSDGLVAVADTALWVGRGKCGTLTNQFKRGEHQTTLPRSNGTLAAVLTKWLAACSVENRIAVVHPGGPNRTSWLSTGTADDHSRPPDTLQFSESGSLLLSACSDPADRRVKLWDTAGGRLLLEWTATGGDLIAALSPDGRNVAVASGGRVALHPLLPSAIQELRGVDAGETAGFALTGGSDVLRLFHYTNHPKAGDERGLDWIDSTGTGKYGWARPRSPFDRDRRALAVHPKGVGVVYSNSDGSICFQKAANGDVRLDGLPSDMDCLAIDPDGMRLWGNPTGTRVHSWKWWSKETATEWNVGKRVRCLAAGSTVVLAGDAAGVLHFIDPDQGRSTVPSLSLPDEGVSYLALNGMETLAVAGTDAGEVILIDVKARKVLHRMMSHKQGVTMVDFHRDDKSFLSGGRDGTNGTDGDVHLYEVAGTGFEHRLTLPFVGRPVSSVRFHPNGTHLVVLLERERGLRFLNLAMLRRGLSELGFLRRS